MNYTKEPWEPFEDVCIQMHPIHDYQAVYITPEDYIRARACVNACAGMPTDDLKMVPEKGLFHLAEFANKTVIERDTYRELCGELLDDLKSQVAAFAYAMGKKSLADSDELITKAEAILGENNAT